MAAETDPSFLFGLISPHCYAKFVDDLDPEAECLKAVFAKAVGLALILGSTLVRVPQILSIYRGGGVEGISIASVYGDVPCYMLIVLYNVLNGTVFSAWGETAFLLAQALVILAQCWYYRRSGAAEIGAALVAGAAIVAGAAQLPADLRPWLLYLTFPMNAASRAPQVLQNLRQGHTGRLSAITVTLNFVGAAARIFTTLVEVKDDASLLVSVALATFWNGTLFAQLLYYREATKAFLAKKKD